MYDNFTLNSIGCRLSGRVIPINPNVRCRSGYLYSDLQLHSYITVADPLATQAANFAPVSMEACVVSDLNLHTCLCHRELPGRATESSNRPESSLVVI